MSNLDADGDSIIQQPTPSTSSLAPLPTPNGPICSYGPRLSFTHFPSPLPPSDLLNSNNVRLGLGAGAGDSGAGEEVHWFTIDDQLIYLSFYMDSGPLNAACLYRFCLHLHTLLEDPTLKSRKIVLYSSDENDKKANAAALIALYAMIVMRWTPADVLHPIAGLELQPYRDAGYSLPTFHLSLQSLLFGIHRAISLTSPPLLDLSTFDLAGYERFEKVEEGDWNWLTPNIIAFASPVEPHYVASSRSSSSTIDGGKRLSRSFRNVLDEFEKGGVKVVVRLNKKLYDREHFLERGIEHVEMYFDDGTNPTMEMTREFIDLADRTISAGGVIAVHCKAGLGRTGTLIGAYLIYKHGFTAAEAIGFMRLMRPGSCVGPQQHYLYENQMTYIRWAAIDQLKKEMADAAPSPSIVNPRPITPPNEIDLARSRAVTPSTSTVPTTPGQVPRTPGRPVAVPGQPRKTPGKSKHSVATPEVRVAEEGEENLEKREDLMLVTEEKEEDEMKDVVPTSPVPSASTRKVTPSSPRKTTRPTRIARARTNTAPQTQYPSSRPLSAITDNRIVDRIGAEEVRRTKAVRELASVFEGPSGSGSGSGRYDLRTSPPAIPAPSSPSRLPTRVPAKRRGKNDTSAGTCQMESLAAPESGVGVKDVGLGRSVRRRRSSLGSTDFVQSN